jgi:hypothetical protein
MPTKPTTVESVNALIARTEERLRKLETNSKESNARLKHILINTVRKYRRERLKIEKRQK